MRHVISVLEARQQELGEPTSEDSSTSPRRIVSSTLTYLKNQSPHMSYPAYRTAGLPITSSHMESTMKELNYRLKGTEKFWSDEGGEAVPHPQTMRCLTIAPAAPMIGHIIRGIPVSRETSPLGPEIAKQQATTPADSGKRPSPVSWKTLGLVGKLLRSVGGDLDAVHGFQDRGSDHERFIHEIAVDDQGVSPLTASDGVGGTLTVDAIVAVLAEQ